MTDEVVGKAVLQVSTDTSQASAGLKGLASEATATGTTVAAAGKKAAAGVDSIGQAATNASKSVEASNARWIKGAETLAATYGKPKSALLEYQAVQRGISADVYGPIIAKLKQTEAATTGLGLSAKQTAFALRGVPAQFTDIVTSIQGGQNPLTVFLQQGGQLKDMFGGIGPAAKALGGYILGLVNPYTIAAAAVAALGLAYYQGSQEADRYNKAVVLTGNYVGKTAGQMADMARAVSGVRGTQGAAADAIATLASTAKISGQDLQRFATTAVTANKQIGQSYEDSAKIFGKFADEPVKASIELNNSLRYLTASTYDQITAAERLGDKQEAAAIAQRAYADAMDQRMATLRSQAGYVERGWDGITGAAKKAWDAMLNIGRPTATEDIRKQAVGLQAQIETALTNPGFSSTAGGAAFGRAGGVQNNALIKRLQAQLAALQPALAQAAADEAKAQKDRDEGTRNQAIIDAKQRLEDQRKATRSRGELRAAEIAQVRRDAETVGLTQAELAKRIADINEKYKDPKGKAYSDDAGAKLLQQYREQAAALQEQLDSTTKIGAQQRTLSGFVQLVADLKEKKVLTADQKSLLATADLIKAQLTHNVALEQGVKSQEAAAKAEAKRLEALQQYNQRYAQIQASIASASEGRQEQYSRSLDAFGQGDRAIQRQQATESIFREYQRYQDQLNRATPTAELGSDDYTAKVENIRAQLQSALRANQEYYSQLDVMQSDWTNGFTAALQNYADHAADVASQAKEAFTGLFDGLSRAGAQWATGSKVDIAGVGKQFIATLIEMELRAAASSLFKSVGGGGGLLSLFGTALGFMGGTAAGPSAASGLGGQNWLGVGGGSGLGLSSGGGLGLSLAGNRAGGGPVAAQSLYEVNERGAPELLSVKGRQYLMMAGQDGHVTPLVAQNAGPGGGAAPAVSIRINNTGMPKDYQIQQISRDEIVLIARDQVEQHAGPVVAGQMRNLSSPVARATSDRFKVEPKR